MIQEKHYFDTCVVIPTRDRKQYLFRALLSVDRQAVLPRQVVVVDDGSVDELRAEELQFLTNITVTLVRNKRSKGGAAARNCGIDRSETKYISFLDDDDAWDSDYLKCIEAVVDDAAVKYEAFFGSKKFVLSSSLESVFKVKRAKNVADLKRIVKNNAVGGTSCVTVSRDALLLSGRFDENLPAFQDYDMWLRLVSKGYNFCPVESAFVWYTVNVQSNQISGNYVNHIESEKIMREKYSTKLSISEYRKFVGAMNFFLAKAVHRRNYVKSLSFTLKALVLAPRLRLLVLFVPYIALNVLGIYTS